MILGIDTSAYTTSISLIKGKTVYLDERIPLQVQRGNRGLRQSEAVFQHIKNVNILSKKLKCFNIEGVGVSARPRDLTDSYMPVFTVGEAFANTIGSALNVPVISLSHQEGHVYSGIWSRNILLSNLLVIHISGGTSDVLKVNNSTIDIETFQLGKGGDLYAGQFVDRVGVSLGLDFPAGDELEKLAMKVLTTDERIPSSVKDYDMSFSGPESAAQRMIQDGFDSAVIARSVFVCIARSLEKVINNAYKVNEYQAVLLVGGVARNTIIMKELQTRVPHKLFVCKKEFSGDNAVGTAFLAQNRM